MNRTFLLALLAGGLVTAGVGARQNTAPTADALKGLQLRSIGPAHFAHINIRRTNALRGRQVRRRASTAPVSGSSASHWMTRFDKVLSISRTAR